MRIVLVIVILLACGCGVAALFWNQNLKYSLPTPVPVNYKPVEMGKRVNLPSSFASGQAYFLHFYNPDCPCSRFNARHLKSLIRSYKDSIQIMIIVLSKNDIEKAKNELGEDLIIKTDPDGLIAKECGVYSTPQAVIIDQQGKLFYRGNYNKSRYCTTRATNFAELSLIALLNHQPSPSFGILASQSYGCELKENNLAFEFF